MFGWIKLISIGDVFTLINGMIGLVAILYIIGGNFILGSLLIFICILTDGLDGYFARRFGRKHLKGRYLDSMSDTVSFCFAPALLIYYNFFDVSIAVFTIQKILSLVAMFSVFALGALRLIRYSRRGYLFKNFSGVPTPVTAFFVIAICFMFGKLFVISFQPLLALLLTIFVSIMMVTDIEFPRVKIRLRKLIALVSVAAVVCFSIYYVYNLGFPAWHDMFRVLVFVMFGVVCGYLILGPVLSRKQRNQGYDFRRSHKQYKKYHKKYRKVLAKRLRKR